MSKLVQGVVRLLFLPSLMVAIAFCVRSSTGEGDGFSGGLVAAMSVALALLGFGPREVRRFLPLGHAAAVAWAGFMLVVGATVVPVMLGGTPLEHRPPIGGREIRLGAIGVNTTLIFSFGIGALVAGSVSLVLARAANGRGRRG
ncbi:MAG TPA: MnhB domain-containing protein [Vulgatibacter sp.]